MSIVLTTPGEAPTRWVLGDRVREMGIVPGTDLWVLEITVPPGSGTPPHRHASVEVFCVTEGEVTFRAFGDGPPQALRAGPGAVVSVPSDAPHNYQNEGAATACMTVVLDHRMVAFFRELGTPTPPPPGPPTPEAMARVLAICARHGITLLDQPPAGPAGR